MRRVTDPQVALLMLALFIVVIFLGFPIAFTMMAMGIIFGYYAYFEPDRMWRSFNRLDETASTWDQWSLWLEGFFNNRIFDLFINQTYTVMSNDVLTAVPLFLFMGYIVERANIVSRLFTTLDIAAKDVPGSLGVAALFTCSLFATATGIVGAVVTLMGLLAFPQMLKAGYRESFAAGIICAGGTLGILIPPSIMLIVYAATSGVSIVRLYAGALLPGFLLVGLYIALRDGPRDPAAVDRAQAAQGGHARDDALGQLSLDDADLVPAAGDPDPRGARLDPLRSRHPLGGGGGRRARRPRCSRSPTGR